ncbi:MAG TPA: STELLO glycosyltransferase family protein [Abditibacterium sp.]|jgi:hypothetical protein
MSTQAIVVTTINAPNDAIRDIAQFAPDWDFIVIGDTKTPAPWQFPGTRYFDVPAQQALDSQFAQLCPTRHYARKNIGYLVAIRNGASIIAETDDDNLPYAGWLANCSKVIEARRVEKTGWENVYTHFSRERIWPRGFPLELINESLRQISHLDAPAPHECAIQQYLANDNPDVDAVFRLTTDREIKFTPNRVVLEKGTYCAFNSQNTIWWPEAFPLLYLPSHVSFRMTDIWRSYVAQVCLYAMGGKLAFCEATMYQIRNEHSLIRDFKDEVPGYLDNMRILDILNALSLSSEPSKAGENLRGCYEALVAAEIVPEAELPLIDAWLSDLSAMKSS